MENLILYAVTLIVTWVLGYFAKKSQYISNHLIPVQNLLIGIIVTIIYWIVSKDFQAALMLTGSLAGGLYDIAHNLQKLAEAKKEEEAEDEVEEEIQDTFNEEDLEAIDTEADIIGEVEEEIIPEEEPTVEEEE